MSDYSLRAEPCRVLGMICTSLSAIAASLMLASSGCGSDSPSGPDWTGDVGYAGVRSSSYGADPYPDPAGWQDCIEAMSSAFPGSTPCALWVVGTVDEGIDASTSSSRRTGEPIPMSASRTRICTRNTWTGSTSAASVSSCRSSPASPTWMLSSRS